MRHEHVLAIFLAGVGSFELFLASNCFAASRRGSRGSFYAGLVSFFNGVYAIFVALSYYRAANGLDYHLTYKLCWIGYLAIPAAMQAMLQQFQSNQKRGIWRFFRGLTSFSWMVWTAAFVSMFFGDWVDRAPVQFIPYIENQAPLESYFRAFAFLNLGLAMLMITLIYRASRGETRAKSSYFLLGCAAYGTTTMITSGGFQLFAGLDFDPGLTALFSIFFSAPSAYAMTRHRLFDVRIVLSRSLFIVSSTTLSAALSYALFALFQKSFSVDLSFVLAVILVLLSIQLSSAGEHLKSLLDRIFKGSSANYDLLVSDLTETFLTSTGLNDVIRRSTDLIRSRMHLTSLSFYLVGKNSVQEIYASSSSKEKRSIGQDFPVQDPLIQKILSTDQVLSREEESGRELFANLDPASLLVPLWARESRLGFLALGEKTDDEVFHTSDFKLLQNIRSQVALAVENARLYQESITDGLTGLFYQKFFKARLAAEISRCERHGGELALLMFDVDHFKRLNDEEGHLVGDKVLEGMGALIRSHFRAEDLRARYGGEEFSILLVSPKISEVRQIADRFRSKIETHPLLPHRKVTISVGITYLRSGEKCTMEDLISRADQALYKAKNSGRNQVIEYSPSIKEIGSPR
jgi:diguanylate cyclase (GGDEF)-like protein